jgi:hypothetical protein
MDNKEESMTDSVNFARDVEQSEDNSQLEIDDRRPVNPGEPSNEVYARVGDRVLRAAQEGVRSGMKPEDIIRQIVIDHNVRLTVGELRLLLAARRIQPK